MDLDKQALDTWITCEQPDNVWFLSDYREQTQHPGKYEGEHPMVPFLDMNDVWDEVGGDVKTFMWFGRAGKWIVTENDQGFMSGRKFPTVSAAKTAFKIWNEMYDDACPAVSDDECITFINAIATGPTKRGTP